MLKRASDRPARRVGLLIDGSPFEAWEGDTVAAALLASGRPGTRRSPVSGAPRGPYCLMGVCFECLVRIDGVPSRQACMVAVAEGMRVETDRGAAAVEEGA